MAESKTYRIWSNPKHPRYDRYGARGIQLQKSWIDDAKAFCQYVESLPGCNPSRTCSLDRIDNNKGYVEGNLRWSTMTEQLRNRAKFSSNKTGVTGVSFRRMNGYDYYLARWREGGKYRNKLFGITTHGLLPAFAKACALREAAIDKLNAQGAGYSALHGK